MKLQCILRRDGGTKAEIGGIEYHFVPLADGAHVAEVAEEAHIDRFLSIPEAYKVYHGHEALTASTSQPVAPVAAKPFVPADGKPLESIPLAGSELHPPQFEIAGRVLTQRSVVQLAFIASGLTSDEWNDLGEDERAAKIDILLDGIADDAGAEPDNAHERETLVEAYKARFGKAPHHRKSIATIQAELAA